MDSAHRVMVLLEFVAGYALLVDACRDGATIDQLRMEFLAIPALEASDVVRELARAVEHGTAEVDTTDGEGTTASAAETPSGMARSLAASVLDSVSTFRGFLNNDGRDVAFQRLLARLTAEAPEVWSRARADETLARLSTRLASDEDRQLFNQYIDHCVAERSVLADAVYLVGVEIGRRQIGGGR